MSYASLFPIAFIDPPEVLNTSVTNIPGSGSSPLQVVANLGLRASHAIDYIDSTGDFIGVYRGPSGQESLITIIGGGVTTRQYCVLPALSRVSLRSMTASAITNGNITLVFMGVGWNGQVA
jgi:hypothetical protein